MYHCHINFYLVGDQHQFFEQIQSVTPLEHFSHTFIVDSAPDPASVARADVIFAALPDMDAAQTVRLLISSMRQNAELILLAGQDQILSLTDSLDRIRDIWPPSPSVAEARFRFTRWQQRFKAGIDHWQTSQYLESTINCVPNLIWYKNKDGIHEKANDSFCHAVNKTKEQVEGQGHAYIWDVDQEDPACIESDLGVMRQKKTCISEETIQTPSGSRLLTTYKSPLYDWDGSVMGTVGVAIDITQEREYQQKLISKTKTLETLFTTMECGILCHTLDGSRILSINRAALKLLGYETLDSLTEDGFDLIASSVVEEDRPLLRESILSLEKEGDSVNVEYRIMHDDGKILHIMGNIKLIQENGELFYQRFLLDCTAQKQRETQREQRQMELVHALCIDYNLVCYLDLDSNTGNTVRINDCKYDILDSIFTKEGPFMEHLEQYIDQCVHADDRRILREALSLETLKQELTEKKMTYTNYRTICNGELRYFQMKVVRSGEWGINHSVVLGFRSVDEETRNEMAKKDALKDALSQATRANKAKSVFLSNISHDIRTPMNAIIGFTTLALSHIENTEQVETYLKKIKTSGNHLLSLINDVLDMSHIESGKMHLTEQLCSLPDIMHGLRNIIQADIHAKQLELHMDAIDVQNENIYCDRLRLNQVLLNLLNNSIKYTPAGGTVGIKLTEKTGAPAGSAHYEFCIHDTGIGMSEEFVAHIFEPFERERNSTISGIQGTGLGMAITKNIVTMMNGSIEVRSEQNVGSEFIVNFTFRLDPGTTEPPTIPELKNCRALVVDDDYHTCDGVSFMLQQMGMRAEWTLSGKEAVLRTHHAIMRKDDYSIYVIDWLLPDMNGVEVARRIRKETSEDVPIIVLTAYDWSDIEDEAKEAGITAFCSKPLFFSELHNCLNSIINLDESQKAADSKEAVASHSERILLVEDNELNQEIAAEILNEAGFTTEIAGNGQIALDMLKASKPGYYELVLMDVQMPEMNGYEATQAIRKLDDKRLSSIPILAMTANAFEEDKQEALKSGMNGHIAKPINIKNLMEELDRILSKKNE